MENKIKPESELKYDDKGFTCECGVYYNHPAYVYAHTKDSLIHTCDNCLRKHRIRELLVKTLGKQDYN